jgi:hypothetical protein
MNNVSAEPKRPGFSGKPGNPRNCQKCLAKTRRGTPCQRPAEKNPKTGLRKRCRLHGGLSTGPIRAPSLKHGRQSRAYREAQKALRTRLAALKAKARASE